MMAMKKKKPNQDKTLCLQLNPRVSYLKLLLPFIRLHMLNVLSISSSSLQLLSACVSMKLLVCNEKLIFFNDFLTLFQERARTSKLASAADGRRLNPWER